MYKFACYKQKIWHRGSKKAGGWVFPSLHKQAQPHTPSVWVGVNIPSTGREPNAQLLNRLNKHQHILTERRIFKFKYTKKSKISVKIKRNHQKFYEHA